MVIFKVFRCFNTLKNKTKTDQQTSTANSWSHRALIKTVTHHRPQSQQVKWIKTPQALQCPRFLYFSDVCSIQFNISWNIKNISGKKKRIIKYPLSAERLLHGAAVSSPPQQGTLLIELTHLQKSWKSWDNHGNNIGFLITKTLEKHHGFLCLIMLAFKIDLL